MFHMVICKGGHGVIRVVVVWLESNIYALVAGLGGGGLEVLGE